MYIFNLRVLLCKTLEAGTSAIHDGLLTSYLCVDNFKFRSETLFPNSTNELAINFVKMRDSKGL
ncbi:hypothetical protein E4N78_01155 [Treponema denticola]|nr:hypothetical protein E4N78_01155 [Treponema denticola]